MGEGVERAAVVVLPSPASGANVASQSHHTFRSVPSRVVELSRVFECTMRARCHEGPALSQDHEPAH